MVEDLVDGYKHLTGDSDEGDLLDALAVDVYFRHLRGSCFRRAFVLGSLLHLLSCLAASPVLGLFRLKLD